MRRTGDTLRFVSRRTREDGPDAVFRARYRPPGPTGEVEAGSVAAFSVGRITKDPWQVSAVDATIRANTLFEATGLPSPADDPVVCYSPGFEMGVEPVERRAVR